MVTHAIITVSAVKPWIAIYPITTMIPWIAVPSVSVEAAAPRKD
jgi:GTPase involved in cell partitioning and DNA repair